MPTDRPIPHTYPPDWPKGALAPDTGRFASTITLELPDGPRDECPIALLGIPDDVGVNLNRGRAGAAHGPRAFRDALSRYAAARPAAFDWPRVYDAGDVIPADPDDNDLVGTMRTTHDRVTEAAAALHERGFLPVLIGGGHDLTFPFVRALANRSSAIRGIYFDPHLDVRPEPGSGMPFRALLEMPSVKGLQNFGFSEMANSREHLEWFLANGGELGEDIDIDNALDDSDPDQPDLFVSLDLDVIDMAFAPGVSAMNPAGWTSRHAEAAVFAAGMSNRVRCFDMMELCPPHDVNARTARLAAHLFLTFLRGFTERNS